MEIKGDCAVKHKVVCIFMMILIIMYLENNFTTMKTCVIIHSL